MFWAQTFRKKIFCFNFNSIIYLFIYLDTQGFLYYKGILAFVFEHTDIFIAL